MRVALLCRISQHTIEQPIFKKSVPGTTPPAHTGVRWKSELGRKLSDEWWQRALDMVNSTSSCARLTLIQFKVLHRIHFSKAKLFNTSYTCDRCSLSSASHTHVCFLSKIKLILVLFPPFYNTLSKAWNKLVLWSPLTSIFGVSEEFTHFTKGESNSIAFASLVARRRILLY